MRPWHVTYLLALLALPWLIQSYDTDAMQPLPEPLGLTAMSTRNREIKPRVPRLRLNPQFDRPLAPISTRTNQKRNLAKNIIGMKFLRRNSQSSIVPFVVGAKALEVFWSSIAIDASVSDWTYEKPKALFTITEGALQATFSCLGQAVPWDFVVDFASQAAEAVARGWTDTFDAYYEQEGTGFAVLVSFRILEKLAKEEADMLIS
ncbi:hypothetical protein MMC28_001688 [Mycoblastus sanguinarius]|nr:hypothetical protein [Mycoblastus sanguinarius]